MHEGAEAGRGRLLAVFPPYYYPGGSHLEGFVSRMPWPKVLFGRKTLIRAVEEILQERNDGYRPRAMRPRDKLWCLNGATIRSREEDFAAEAVRRCASDTGAVVFADE